MMMFEDIHGHSICHIPAKRMLEQLQDNKGANLQHTEAESKAGSGGAECFSKARGKLCLASLACESMVQGPQHFMNLVRLQSTRMHLLHHCGATVCRVEMSGAYLHQSCQAPRHAESDQMTKRAVSITSLNQFNPIQSRRRIVAETLAYNVQHIVVLKLRQTATILSGK